MSDDQKGGEYEIYRLQVFDLMKNHFQTDREESWTIVKEERSFSDLQLARDYVVQQSRIHTDLPIYIYGISSTKEKSDVIEQFCFTNDRYMIYRRFFIGYPPVDKIRKALVTAGINVLPTALRLSNHQLSNHQP
jgi:hypothetical protein